jgi:hypothetical protein
MATLNFPLNPTLNDTYTFEGKTWTWNGYAWKLNSASYFLDNIKTVDGSGSQLDADLLDGQDSTAFASAAQGALADSAVQPNDDAVLSTLQLTGGTGDEGTLSWNNSDKTLDLAMGEAVQQIGQEIFYMVRNETGSTIANGTPVFANGATAGSNRVTISGMIADGSVASMRYLGITTQDITSGVNGLVTSFGYVRDIDTRGTIYGEDWQVGDVLYVSQSTAGALTNVAPTSGLMLPVAIVINRHQTAGVLIVRSEAAISATAEDGVLAKTAYSWGDHGVAGYAQTSLTVAKDSSTGAAQLPVGTEAQRPSGAVGQIRFNTETAGFEGYDGTEWGAVGWGYFEDSNILLRTNTLNNPNAYSTPASDQFGASVAISESYAIVGATYEDAADGNDGGKAYIFSTTDWSLLYTLDNPNAYSTHANDYFGSSVAISESYAIVGAYGEDDVGGSTSGKAYIYSTADGSLLYTLDNPNAYSTSSSDFFGLAVAISESYAIVAAYKEDDADGNDNGKVYVFSTTDGSLLHTLDNPNAYSTTNSDQFGYSLAISGNYVIIGANTEGDAGGAGSGKVYVFSTTDWSLLHTLDNPNAYSDSAQDRFGNSVAISGNYAIVGAVFEDDISGSSSGKAYIFSTTDWSLLYTLDNPNVYSTGTNDNFGSSVAISDSYAIVTAYYEDDTSGNSSGNVYIYSTADGSLLYTLYNPNAYSTAAGDLFGYSVGVLSNGTIIISARGEGEEGNANSGIVYIYKEMPVLTTTTSINAPTLYQNSTKVATTLDIANSQDWDTAYSWGDHSTQGYLTSFTETDPVFTASEAYSITSANKTDWSTAYSWGNHASAGYAQITLTVAKDSATGAAQLPVGTEAERPSGTTGQIRFNTDAASFEGYDGTEWGALGGGGSLIVSETAPTDPDDYAIWFNSTNGKKYTYYVDADSSQWVEL